jgi:hypothetical protein
MSDVDRIPPRPEATIEAIRAIGYSFESAIADIIDNSLSAGSSNVQITLRSDDLDTFCAVADDGTGMNEDELREAMRIGSGGSRRVRLDSDLGRFGMGLKSAGFSQARRVSVFSKRLNGQVNTRVWDLDQLGTSDDWVALKVGSVNATQFAESQLEKSGTVVVLERLDGSLKLHEANLSSDEIQKVISSAIVELSTYLARVFGRLISRKNGPRLSINGHVVEPWLPFVEHSASQELPMEEIRVAGVVISCRSYVIPHPEMPSNLSSTERQIYLEQLFDSQGFYLYRKHRLICGGLWLDGRHHKEMETSLARIEIDVPVDLDRNWELTVDKTRFRPPKTVKDDLARLAELARGKSRRVYRSRGVSRPSQVSSGKARVPIVDIGTLRGETFARFNEAHPLVAQMLELPDRRLVRTFLGIANDAISQVVTKQSHNDSEISDTLPIPDEVRECARILFERFALQPHLSRSEIRGLMLSIDPFVNYPSVVEELFVVNE